MNNLALVILIHDQARNLPRLIKAYKGLAEKPALFVFVLDRCQDNSRSILESSDLNAVIVDVAPTGSFMAGSNRDVGLRVAEEKLPNCDVLFLDGDCEPTTELIASHVRNLQLNASYPTVTVGRRIDENEVGDILHDDTRIIHARVNRRVFGNGDRIVLPKSAANCRMLTWSCNLGLNRKMIELCRWTNNAIGNEKERVFNDAFDGRWGGEDDFVGLTASYFGAVVIALDPKQHVRHIWHKSRQNDAYARTMRVKQGQLKDLAKQTGAYGIVQIDCVDSLEDFDRCWSATRVELRDPLLQFILKANKLDTLFEQASLSTALAYPAWVLKAGDAKPPAEANKRWKELRQRLIDITSADTSVNVIKDLVWDFKPLSRQHCVVCDSTAGFASNGRCRSCNSYPWHRLAAKVVPSMPGRRAIFNADTRAERLLFNGWDFYSYKGLNGDAQADLEDLKLADESYDVTYSAHTLEHVKNDRKALDELRRITAVGGVALVSVPTNPEGFTSEDLGVLSPAERTQRFWWHDHWRLYGRDVTQRFNDAGFSVERIHAADFGHIDGVAPDEVMFALRCQTARPTQNIAKPQSLYLDVFDSCNYACKHCNIHLIKDSGNVDVELYRNIIAEFAALGGRDIQFGSGETLLKKTLVLDLLRIAKSNGLICNIVMNGSCIRKADDAIELRTAGLDVATVSVDSRIAEEHDLIRGVIGAFDQALLAAKLLKDAGVRVKASCVLTRDNVVDFPRYVIAMRAAGFDEVSCTLLEPTFAHSRFKRDAYYEANCVIDHEAVEKALALAVEFGASFYRVEVERIVGLVKNGLANAGDCNSSDRNVIVTRAGQIRLCYGKESVGEYRKAGDLASIWSSNKAVGRRFDDARCTKYCAVSECHRRKSSNS
jgi:MoaA/NifB/PqqE/SkfB family radical SAM enzyme/SAM-dependent methyltransferase